MKKRILIADDEECIRSTFSDFLVGGGYQVATAETLPDCMAKMREDSFDLLFLDVGFGLDNGIESIEEIKTLQPNCSVVIITGSLNSTGITSARHYGAADYLVKPVRQPSLLYIAQKILADNTQVRQ